MDPQQLFDLLSAAQARVRGYADDVAQLEDEVGDAQQQRDAILREINEFETSNTVHGESPQGPEHDALTESNAALVRAIESKRSMIAMLRLVEAGVPIPPPPSSSSLGAQPDVSDADRFDTAVRAQIASFLHCCEEMKARTAAEVARRRAVVPPPAPAHPAAVSHQVHHGRPLPKRTLFQAHRPSGGD